MNQKLAYRLFKTAFRSVETIASPLAVHWAARLFFVPPRNPRPVKERTCLQAAKIDKHPMSGHQFVDGRCGEYYTYSWGNGPTVLLVHGWGGRGTQLYPLINPLLQAGYRVLSFDGPAHGDSSGSRTNIYEFEWVLQDLQERYGAFETIVAHSFGGVASAFSLNRGLETRQLVTISSPATMEYLLSTFCRQIGGSDAVAEQLGIRFSDMFNTPLDSFSLKEIIAPLHLPGLVIHDRDDKEVDFFNGEELATQWQEAEFMPTSGLGHRRILADKAVIRRVVDFIDRPHRPGKLVSGRNGVAA